MNSVKRLRSVVQSTAHHAVSGLCYVHPHLGIECKKYSYNQISVDLINQDFEPKLKEIPKEITLSISALRETFFKLLAKEKIEESIVSAALAIFCFQKGKWPSACVVRVTTNEGQVIEKCVDSSGKSGEIIQ